MINWRLETFAELESTSNLCVARAKNGEPEGLAVLAAAQTSGRGSRGREWVSKPGNMYLSVLLRPAEDISILSAFPLLAGLAVANAVHELQPALKPMLKWPNDVLLNGGKLAGVLIDASPVDHRIDWLVIGIGINLAYAPEIPGRSTTCLAHFGDKITPRQMAEQVLATLAAWLATLHASGISAIQTAWLAAAHPLGTEITVRGNGTVTGSFAGLSPNGALQLLTENRIETFQTGDILLGPQGS